MTKKLQLTATTNANRVRAFCIKHDYYTAGTNAEYMDLLGYVDTHKLLDVVSLEHIASNIVKHSDLTELGLDYLSTVDYMVDNILNECCWISYEVDE